MKKVCSLLFILIVATSAMGQTMSLGSFVDTAQTVDQYIREHLDKYVTPEYRQRHNLLRSYQRDGYCNILMHLLEHDVVLALLDHLKTSIDIDYSLNHGPILYPGQRGGFELPFDWTFPADPWKQPSWVK